MIKSKTLTSAANLTELKAIEKKFEHHSLLNTLNTEAINEVGAIVPKINMDAINGDERPI
jgi:hypothetical protein